MKSLFKQLSFLVCLSISAVSLSAQNEADGLVKWLTFEEAQAKNKVLAKPMIIDLYTDWCGWCKHMMRTTYSNPGVAAYINENFYPIKFNAETKDTIEYNGKVYKPLSKEPKTPHELAVKFLGNSLSYPSTMFITNNYEFNLLSQGFIEDKKLEPILIFMVENAWRTSIFDEFGRHFNNAFYDTSFAKIPVKMYSMNEVEKLQKKKPKKVLVNVTASFCNSCKVMERTTFVDSSIAGYLNKNFYVVNFSAESNDTIVFKGQKYFKGLVNNYPLHTFAAKITENRFSFPSLSILDEQLNTIDVLNFYQSPEQLKPILEFVGGNAYKTKKFQEFMKDYSEKKSQVVTKKK
jgi:thioredoxin-related protein